MEIIEKRKRDQSDLELHGQSTRGYTSSFLYQLPPEVEAALNEKQRNADVRLSLLDRLTEREQQVRREQLHVHRLMPFQLRQRVYTSLQQGNTPQQLLSVIAFLFQLQSAVINGEKVPHVGSAFCKIPFSK